MIKLNLDSGIEFAQSVYDATGDIDILSSTNGSDTLEDVIKFISDNRCPNVGIYLINHPGIPLTHMIAAACIEYDEVYDDDIYGRQLYDKCCYRNLKFYSKILKNLERGRLFIRAIDHYNMHEDIVEALWLLTDNNL